MQTDTLFVFALIGVAAAAMASNRVRFDIVALLVVLALMLSGVLSVGESLAGFGSPVVILVAGLLVVGEMLDRTGVAATMGNWILEKGGASEARLLVIIMASAALLGAVMSSTAIVAIFIPIVLRIAAETGVNASRLLLPMSYAALISGMLTLIATTPNLVVSEELKHAGYLEFGFFSFTPLGLAILVAAIGYMLLLGRRLLPERGGSNEPQQTGRLLLEMWEDYRGGRRWQLFELTGHAEVSSIGELGSAHSLRFVGVKRAGRGANTFLIVPENDTVLQPGDVLLAIGVNEELQRLADAAIWRAVDMSDADRRDWAAQMAAATILIHPESSTVGKTLKDLQFKERFGLTVLGVRHAQVAEEDYEERPLSAADSLLVVGPTSQIRQLQADHHEFIVMETSRSLVAGVPDRQKMGLALAILAVMVALSVFDLVPLVAAVLMACLAAVVSRCLTMEDSYRAIHWGSIVLVAGMLPLADALEKTGGTQIIVDALMAAFGESGPYAMMSVVFFLTAALGLFLSNTASAVLVAPIAIYVAEALGVSPYPFAIAVLIAASAAFMTPVSTPVVTLVVDPGRYAFMDFVRIGVPLLLVTYAVTLLLAPLLFPL